VCWGAKAPTITTMGVSPRAKHTEEGGKADIQMEKDRKGRKNGMLLLTKLLLLRHQVTLSPREVQSAIQTVSMKTSFFFFSPMICHLLPQTEGALNL
jgi:hypothetical protein